jgi:hypothetical protein
MQISMRRALTAAALFGVAGCNGGNTQTQTLPSEAAYSVVHHGVPFVPMLRTRRVSHTITPTYPTTNSLVFEGDQNEAAVNIYQTSALKSNPPPIATIKVAAGCPYGMAMNRAGTLYVADNCGGNDVEEYAKGSTTLSGTITDGISNPLGLAIDRDGTLYVSNYPASITVYPAGSSSPSETITGGGLTDPFGLALDSSGNLYIADFGAHAVFELPFGATSVTNLNLTGITEPLGVAVNQADGYLWETDGEGNVINVYHLGSTTPFKTIAGNGFPYAISLQNDGRSRRRRDAILHSGPKGEVVESDNSTKEVYAYKPGRYSSYTTLNDGVENPTGMLVTTP